MQRGRWWSQGNARAVMFPDLEREARIFSRYLVGEDVSEGPLSLYKRAHGTDEFPLDHAEERLLRLIYRHPRLLGIVDGGLAVARRESTIRKKLFYMLGILEATPEFADHYLFPARPRLRGLPTLVLFGSRGVARMLIGYVIVRLL